MTTSSTKPRKRAAKDSGNGSVEKLARGPLRRDEREFRVCSGAGTAVFQTSMTDDGEFVVHEHVEWEAGCPRGLPECRPQFAGTVTYPTLRSAVGEAVNSMVFEVCRWLEAHREVDQAYQLVDDLRVDLGDWDFVAAIGMTETDIATPNRNGERWAEIKADYQAALGHKLKRLLELHFSDLLDQPLTKQDMLLCQSCMPCTPSHLDGKMKPLLSLVQRYERELATPDETQGLTPPGSPGADPRSALAGGVGVFRKTGEVVEVAIDDCATLAANPIPDPAEVERIADSFRWRGQDEPIIVLPANVCPRGVLFDPASTVNLEWIVLAGATRLAAAKRCGWSKIQARVRDEAMTTEEILGFAFRNNTDRRTVTTAEKAAYAAALAELIGDCEGRDAAVAQQMGLDRSEVNQLLRFARLPQIWRDRVSRFERDASDPDSISWTCAKAFLPYADLPGVMAAIEETWTDDLECEESSRLARKDSVRECVRWAALQATRPLDKSDKHNHDYGWQNGGYQPRLYPLTDELRDRLGIVTIRDGDEVLERITNVELNDELQKPYLAKIVAKNATPGSSKAKAKQAADDEQQLSPAEQAREDAAKAKQQDRELIDRIQRPGGLREQALRWSMANAFCSPGDLTDGLFHALVATVAQNEYASPIDWREWQCEAIRMLWSQRDPSGKSVPKNAVARSRLDHHVLLVEYAEKTKQSHAIATAHVRQMLVRMILFPQQPAKAESHVLASADTWPDRWPFIPMDVLEYWSRVGGATVMETWRIAAADANSSSWQWFDRFIAAHNRRQLQALARQSGQESQLKGAKTLAEERQRMAQLHADQLLPLPAVLQFAEAKKKGGRK